MNAQNLGNTPILSLVARDIDRGTYCFQSIANLTTRGESIGQDTEVIGHPRQVIYGPKLLDSLPETLYAVRRTLVLHTGQRRLIESRDWPPGNEAMARDILRQHRDIATAFLEVPAPEEDRAGVG